MGKHSRPRDRRGIAAAAATAVCGAAGAGLLALGLMPDQAGPPQPSGTAVSPSASPAAVATPFTPPSTSALSPGARQAAATSTPTRTAALPRAVPTALAVPAIDLRTENLVRLGRTDSGRLEVPDRWQAVGWYTGGPAPGQAGPAVMAGHVDSDDGPAVFYRLGALKPGAKVKVRRADGKTATFTVYAVESHSKDAFPTEKVYGGTGGRPELRLITCGGTFNEATQHYEKNIVAYARLTRVHPAGG